MTLGMERREREREKNKNGLIFSPLPLLVDSLTPPGGAGKVSTQSVKAVIMPFSYFPLPIDI